MESECEMQIPFENVRGGRGEGKKQIHQIHCGHGILIHQIHCGYGILIHQMQCEYEIWEESKELKTYWGMRIWAAVWARENGKRRGRLGGDTASFYSHAATRKGELWCECSILKIEA